MELLSGTCGYRKVGPYATGFLGALPGVVPESKVGLFVTREDVDANSGRFAFRPKRNVGGKADFLGSA